MELKIKYQYTYFIKPFLIKENKYEKYLLSLLQNKDCKLKIFGEQKDFNIYSHFLQKTRSYFFPSFAFDKEKISSLDKMENNMKAIYLSKMPCNMFEYNVDQRIQGKIDKEDGIFFNIDKIEILCFHTGICFFIIKTELENNQNFANLLDFNHKFKDINSNFAKLKDFNNIKIQTDKFSNMSELSDFINNIIGVNDKCSEFNNIDLFNNDFFVYTYSCLDQEYWNTEEDFKNNLQSFFLKYNKVLASNSELDLNVNESNIITEETEEYKYSKFGFTKYSATLLTSSIDINNYTKLLFEYENEYLYTLIISLYQRMYLKKLENSFTRKINLNKIRKDFLEFTQNVWMNDVTNSVRGSLFYNKWKSIFELDKIYEEIKHKYDIVYKELKIDKNNKINKTISVALAISLALNVINLITLIKIL